jgi:PAT family beta-lactamase induction signal transducer AmpG
MALERSTLHKLGLLGALYFSQGLPFGFFTQALPVLMRREGRSLAEIGLSSLLALPWALKFLVGPLVDRYGSARFGRRRSWIVPLQLAATSTLFALAFFEGASIRVLVAAVLLTNLLAATQDVATDGWAVELLEPHERGLANGLQVAGYRLGMILGGGVLLTVIDALGWREVFFVMSALLGLATIPALLAREAPRAVAPEHDGGGLGGARLAGFFRRPAIGRVLAIVTTFKLGEAFAAGMIRPYLVDVGFGLSDVGLLYGTVGSVAGLTGALLGGWGVSRLSRRGALVAFGAGQVVAVATYAALAATHPAGAHAAGEGAAPPVLLTGLVLAVEHVLVGMGTAALFTAMMDWCRQGSEATDYTVLACLVVVSTGAASALSGFSAERLGYAGHFGAALALAVLGVAVVARAWPAHAASIEGATAPR